MKWWGKELQSCRTGCWGQTQVGELTHGSTGLSSMPLPLSVQTSNAHRLPAPVQSLLRAPPSRASHLAATRASSIHPHTTSLPTFRLRPQSQPPSAWTFPSPPGPTPPHYVPAMHSAFTAPRSRSFHPRRLCASPFLFLRPYSTSPLHFSPYPPPPPPQRLPQRHALQARLTCAATPVPALVRLLQLEGDGGPERLQTSPGGAGRDWGRAAPPEPPGPSATRPPGTSASAARCGPRHCPPAGRTARPPRTHSEPHTAPNPRCRCLSALRGGDRPPQPGALIGLRIPRPLLPTNPPLDLPLPEDDWLACLAIQLQDPTSIPPPPAAPRPRVRLLVLPEEGWFSGTANDKMQKRGASHPVPGSMQIRCHVTSGKVGAGPGPRPGVRWNKAVVKSSWGAERSVKLSAVESR